MWTPIPQCAASPVRNGSPVSATCPVMPSPTRVCSTSIADPDADEVAAERDRPQVLALADEHAAVVVVDQEPELVGDRRADLGDVVEPAELRRDAVQHLQVRDRAELGRPRREAAVGPLGVPPPRRRRSGPCRAPWRSSSRPRRTRRARAGSPRAPGRPRCRSRGSPAPTGPNSVARDLLLDALGEPERLAAGRSRAR